MQDLSYGVQDGAHLLSVTVGDKEHRLAPRALAVQVAAA